MKYTAIIDGERLEIELVRAERGVIQAEIGGEKYVLDVQAVEPGVYWFRWKDRSIEISVTPNTDTYVVSVNGQRIDVEIIDARGALRKAAQHGHAGTVELRAPMPGKVVKLLVSEGAAVDMNQGLLVIEAMKMQNEIKSPKKGTVQKLGVKETAAVNAGDLLAIVE
jgi:biotin carboxyl carrier protein